MRLSDVGAFIVTLIILFTLPFLLGKMGPSCLRTGSWFFHSLLGGRDAHSPYVG